MHLKPIYISPSLTYKPSPSLQHFGSDYYKSLPNGLLASNASPLNSIRLAWCFNTMNQVLHGITWLPVYICLGPLSCLSPALWSSFLLLSLPQTHQARFHPWRSALFPLRCSFPDSQWLASSSLSDLSLNAITSEEFFSEHPVQSSYPEQSINVNYMNGIIIISWYFSCLFVNCHLSLNEKWRKFTPLIMSKVFKITPRFSDLLARLTGLSNYMLRTYTYDLLRWVDTKQNQQRKKAPEVREPGPTAKSPFPMRVTEDTLNSSTAHVKCCLPRKLIGDSASAVSVGTGHLSPLCLACSKIPDSRREGGIQHKPYC